MVVEYDIVATSGLGIWEISPHHNASPKTGRAVQVNAKTGLHLVFAHGRAEKLEPRRV